MVTVLDLRWPSHACQSAFDIQHVSQSLVFSGYWQAKKAYGNAPRSKLGVNSWTVHMPEGLIPPCRLYLTIIIFNPSKFSAEELSGTPEHLETYKTAAAS